MQQRAPNRQEAMTKTPRFADILSTAWTQHGLKRVSTEVLQFPNEANQWTTIVHATVETDRGTFSAIGDANPENAGRMIAPHAIRFSESRAIARALRWATNAGEAIDVEMGDYDPRKQRDSDDDLPEYTPEAKPTPIRTPAAVAGGAPTAVRAQTPLAQSGGMARNTQLADLRKLGQELGWDDVQLEQKIAWSFGQPSIAGLSAGQAEEAMELFRAYKYCVGAGIALELPPHTADRKAWLAEARREFAKTRAK